jgi:uncharacterized protein (DUF2147 family)
LTGKLAGRTSHNMRSAAAISALVALTAAQQPAHAPIEGLWRNPIGSAIIAIAPCGHALCGKVVWASARGRREASPGARNVVGTTVLTNVRPSHGRWAGNMFVPDDNIHVTARLQLLNARELKLSGCGLMGLICRAQVWTRTEPPLPTGD